MNARGDSKQPHLEAVIETMCRLGGSRSTREIYEAGVIMRYRTGETRATLASVRRSLAQLVELGAIEKISEERPILYRIPARLEEAAVLSMIEGELDRMVESGELECRIDKDGVKRYWASSRKKVLEDS